MLFRRQKFKPFYFIMRHQHQWSLLRGRQMPPCPKEASIRVLIIALVFIILSKSLNY